MHVANPHRLSPLLNDTEHRLQDPVVPAVLGPDGRNCLLGDAAIGAISGARKLDAAIQEAPFQQGFQGSRRVGMVSG
jgi:hypothetical protein